MIPYFFCLRSSSIATATPLWVLIPQRLPKRFIAFPQIKNGVAGRGISVGRAFLAPVASPSFLRWIDTSSFLALANSTSLRSRSVLLAWWIVLAICTVAAIAF